MWHFDPGKQQWLEEYPSTFVLQKQGILFSPYDLDTLTDEILFTYDKARQDPPIPILCLINN